MTARTTRTRAAALVLAGALMLAGCTGGGGDDGAGSGGASANQAGGGASDPGQASAATGSMAEQKIGTPHGGGDAMGGEVTVTLRSVEVGAENMTVRWALRWDNDAQPADAGASYYDMGVEPITTVTDRAALKAYKPFCTDGGWKPTKAVEDQSLTETIDQNQRQQKCAQTMLVSPLENVTFEFPNHGTVEAWAILPAPEGKPKTVDVAPAEGLPMFTDATVTYLDEAAE